jgi:16S rRNA (cytosine1402-N4)-methyltransferase
LLRRVGPTGRLVCLDMDAENLTAARDRLAEIGHPFSPHHGNFAGLSGVLGGEGIGQVAGILADLGMSSMQVDDAERGFSYSRDGPLDMRMDRTRGTPACDLVAAMDPADLAKALHELGDEPDADRIAPSLVEAAKAGGLARTGDVVRVIQATLSLAQPWKLHPEPGKWNLHPAARTFQALRILVNRELANLRELMRQAPFLLAPGGKIAVISFHSGEDRIVKVAFRDGLRAGVYDAIADDPIRSSFDERLTNPRARSARLRWARRATERTP